MALGGGVHRAALRRADRRVRGDRRLDAAELGVLRADSRAVPGRGRNPGSATARGSSAAAAAWGPSTSPSSPRTSETRNRNRPCLTGRPEAACDSYARPHALPRRAATSCEQMSLPARPGATSKNDWRRSARTSISTVRPKPADRDLDDRGRAVGVRYRLDHSMIAKFGAAA
jgi:hypothetical protein